MCIVLGELYRHRSHNTPMLLFLKIEQSEDKLFAWSFLSSKIVQIPLKEVQIALQNDWWIVFKEKEMIKPKKQSLSEAKKLLKLATAKMELWDMAVACTICDKTDWDEDASYDPTLNHKIDCPFYGSRVAAAAQLNVRYIEKKLGYHVGN